MKRIPAATTISHLVKASNQDAYFMALLDEKGKPFAQFGWSLQGWKEYVERINMQIALYEAGAELTDGGEDEAHIH
jgi:hypothetical protein